MKKLLTFNYHELQKIHSQLDNLTLDDIMITSLKEYTKAKKFVVRDCFIVSNKQLNLFLTEQAQHQINNILTELFSNHFKYIKDNTRTMFKTTTPLDIIELLQSVFTYDKDIENDIIALDDDDIELIENSLNAIKNILRNEYKKYKINFMNY